MAGRPAGHVPRPQGDEGRPGKNTDMGGGGIEIVLPKLGGRGKALMALPFRK